MTAILSWVLFLSCLCQDRVGALGGRGGVFLGPRPILNGASAPMGMRLGPLPIGPLPGFFSSDHNWSPDREEKIGKRMFDSGDRAEVCTWVTVGKEKPEGKKGKKGQKRGLKGYV